MEYNWVNVSFADDSPYEMLLERIPQGEKAIYMICLDCICRVDDEDEIFFKKIERICSLPFGEHFEAVLKFKKIAIKHDNKIDENNSYLTQENFEACSTENDDFKKFISAFSKSLQEIAPPLYVGETSNLRQRIKEHFSDNSPLMERLKDQEISIKDLSIRYMEIQGQGSELLDDVEESNLESDNDYIMLALTNPGQVMPSHEKTTALFIEEFATRLLRPGFVRKIGKKNFKVSL